MDLNDELKEFLREFESFDIARNKLEDHVRKRVKKIVGDYDSISVNLHVTPTYDKDVKFIIDIEIEDPFNVFDLELSSEQVIQLKSTFRAPHKFSHNKERVDGKLKTTSLNLSYVMKNNWSLD